MQTWAGPGAEGGPSHFSKHCDTPRRCLEGLWKNMNDKISLDKYLDAA